MNTVRSLDVTIINNDEKGCVVKAHIYVKGGLDFEAHGAGKTLEEAEDMAIRRVYTLAGIIKE